MVSNESSDKNEFIASKTKLSASSESHADEEVSSELSDTKGHENIGIVKSILGPSFEDAVLRTLEFGKSLIQKNENSEGESKVKNGEKRREFKEKRKSKTMAKDPAEKEKGERRSSRRELLKEQRSAKRKVMHPEKRDMAEGKPVKKVTDLPHVRPMNVAKIRSLDSELKQVAPSPEKIKRQLEALIQINKDEPPECANTWGYFSPKDFKPVKSQLQYTIFPSTVTRTPCCPLSKEEECTCGTSCTGSGNCCQGSREKKSHEESETVNYGGGSAADTEEAPPPREKKKKGYAVNMRQAPEYISNALGPTLDESIMDNLKLMRNLFKCDRGEPDEKGEPQPGTPIGEESEGPATVQHVEDLQRKVDELTAKQQKLLQEIEKEEQERDAKRKAFEEEEKKLKALQACLQEMADEERVRQTNKRQTMNEYRDYEQKFEALICRIKSEEDRLNKLKDQNDCYKKEIIEAKQKKDVLKRNKSLLDAWDVIASKACHTRLPSFSKAQCLERKNLKEPKDHCCFPQKSEEKLPKEDSRSRINICVPKGSSSRSKSLDCKSSKSKMKTLKEMQCVYPLQRDIICGMHRNIKTCMCSEPQLKDHSWSSDDEGLKCNKKGVPPVQRSKSETGQKQASAKLCKVLWAVTRINIFQDNSRTYEVMDATTMPPKCPPVKTEGVFVVKNPSKPCSGRPKKSG